MSTPNPRTRYGMVGGVVAVVVGYALLFQFGLGSSQTASYLGIGTILFGIVLGNVAAVADAWYLRKTQIGASVFATVVLVVLLGPVWVLVALLRRVFNGQRKKAAEKTG